MTQNSPEYIERQMFEIRTRVDPDMQDLKKHLQPKVIADQAKNTARERAQKISTQLKNRLKDQRRELQDSAEFQYSLARKASRDGDTAPLTDAVRNDPRPAIALAAALVTLLVLAKRILS